VPKSFLAVAVRSLFSRTPLTRPATRSVRHCRAAALEPLEARALFSVSLDANGFTVVTPSQHSRVVHVSSTLGDDANDGLSPERPVRSIARGASMLRDGSADQLLLNRGDVWREALGEWSKGGRNAQEPMVIGAYGAGPRPRLETGTRTALSISSASTDVEHLSILGLHLVASARVPGMADFVAGSDGGNGLRVLANVEDLLVEDCVIQAYETNVLLQDHNGPQHNVVIRRSSIVDAYSAGQGHSQGLYAYGVVGLTLEGNLFDHNGWSETVPGAPATMFNHNIYLSSNNANVVIRGNVIANAASHGLQARSGGRVENNVFLDNPVGMTFGVVKGATVTAGGVSGVINGNVFLGTRDIAGEKRGKGLEVGNTRPNIPTVVSNNIFAHANAEYGSDYAMLLSYAGDGSPNGELAAGLNDVTVQGNIVYRWSKGLRFDGAFVPGGTGRFALNRVTIRGNDFQQLTAGRMVAHMAPLDPAQEKWLGNRYDGDASDASAVDLAGKAIALGRWIASHEPTSSAARAAYADGERTADSYSALTTGTASRAALLAELRANSSQSWRPQFTAAGVIDYVRGGFAEEGAAARDWRAPTAPIATATAPATPVSGDALLTFAVTYGDDKVVDLASLDAGDVRVVGRKGRVDVPASVVSVTGGGEGQPVVVTYAAAAPDGAWDRRDRGKYTLVAQERQVADNEGFFLAAGELASFKLKVAPRPKTPPTLVDRAPRVIKASISNKAPQSVTFRFSEDVAATVSVDDLVLRSEDGATTIDPSLMTVSYDAARRAATWSFTNLPAGRYRATLLASGITDAAGQQLDGNRDGTPGGDLALKPMIRA
jgi:hypothetical protein